MQYTAPQLEILIILILHSKVLTITRLNNQLHTFQPTLSNTSATVTSTIVTSFLIHWLHVIHGGHLATSTPTALPSASFSLLSTRLKLISSLSILTRLHQSTSCHFFTSHPISISASNIRHVPHYSPITAIQYIL